MKLLCTLVCILIVLTAYSQKSKDSLKYKPNPVTLTMEDLTKRFIQPYIDSLNNYTAGDFLPKFLLEPSFDADHFAYWPANHRPISFRYLIFSKVTNLSILKEILVSQEGKLKEKLEGYKSEYFEKIPFQEFSNCELASYRFDQLTNEKYYK